MIIAITQVNLTTGHRSQNLSNLISVITEAAEHPDTPDLIVLPNLYEANSIGSAPLMSTKAMCEAFTEALACQAREWGVWIAAGHVASCSLGCCPSLTLFDPDGDKYGQRGLKTIEGRCREIIDKSQYLVTVTPLGIIGLCCITPGESAETSLPSKDLPLDLLITNIGEAKLGCDTESLVSIAKRENCFVCSANLITNGEQRQKGIVIDRTGDVIATTSDAGPSIKVTRLGITPPPADVLAAWMEPENVE